MCYASPSLPKQCSLFKRRTASKQPLMSWKGGSTLPIFQKKKNKTTFQQERRTLARPYFKTHPSATRESRSGSPKAEVQHVPFFFFFLKPWLLTLAAVRLISSHFHIYFATLASTKCTLWKSSSSNTSYCDN